MGDNPDFVCMSKTQTSAFAANLVANKRELERLQNIFIKEKASAPSSACSTNEHFLFNTDVLNYVEDSSPWLPVAIDGVLTHI